MEPKWSKLKDEFKLIKDSESYEVRNEIHPEKYQQ